VKMHQLANSFVSNNVSTKTPGGLIKEKHFQKLKQFTHYNRIAPSQINFEISTLTEFLHSPSTAATFQTVSKDNLPKPNFKPLTDLIQNTDFKILSDLLNFFSFFDGYISNLRSLQNQAQLKYMSLNSRFQNTSHLNSPALSPRSPRHISPHIGCNSDRRHFEDESSTLTPVCSRAHSRIAYPLFDITPYVADFKGLKNTLIGQTSGKSIHIPDSYQVPSQFRHPIQYYNAVEVPLGVDADKHLSSLRQNFQREMQFPPLFETKLAELPGLPPDIADSCRQTLDPLLCSISTSSATLSSFSSTQTRLAKINFDNTVWNYLSQNFTVISQPLFLLLTDSTRECEVALNSCTFSLTTISKQLEVSTQILQSVKDELEQIHLMWADFDSILSRVLKSTKSDSAVELDFAELENQTSNYDKQIEHQTTVHDKLNPVILPLNYYKNQQMVAFTDKAHKDLKSRLNTEIKQLLR